MAHHWGYGEENGNGPLSWHKEYPLASSGAQSPINIDTKTAVYNEELTKTPLEISYENLDLSSIQNNGHTFQITGKLNPSKVTGGPVNDSYKFAQFHLHWGENENGSEHTIDEFQYASEIHFVNWNIDKFSSASEAMTVGNHEGLLVLGVFVKLGAENEEMKKIVNSFNDIRCSKTAKFCEALIIKNLFPRDISKYYSYNGSLTTPPCYQSVQWVVFNDPIEISVDQLKALKNLYKCSNQDECCEDKRIKSNFRPVCPNNERIVYKSFI